MCYGDKTKITTPFQFSCLSCPYLIPNCSECKDKLCVKCDPTHYLSEDKKSCVLCDKNDVNIVFLLNECKLCAEYIPGCKLFELILFLFFFKLKV